MLDYTTLATLLYFPTTLDTLYLYYPPNYHRLLYYLYYPYYPSKDNNRASVSLPLLTAQGVQNTLYEQG